MIRNQTFTQPAPGIIRFRGILTGQLSPKEENSALGSPQTIEIDQGKIRIRIPIQNILFVKAEHVYSRIFFFNDQRILQRISLDKLLRKLPKEKFLRVHRSYLVNVDHIVKFNSTKVLIGDTVIPIGRSWRDKVMPRLRLLTQG